MGSFEPLHSGSSSHLIYKQCAAQTCRSTGPLMPCLVLTAYTACGLLVRVQLVVSAPTLSSAWQSLRLSDHPQRTGERYAREPCLRDDLALPQAYSLRRRCRQCMIWCSYDNSDRMPGRPYACFSA